MKLKWEAEEIEMIDRSVIRKRELKRMERKASEWRRNLTTRCQATGSGFKGQGHYGGMGKTQWK